MLPIFLKVGTQEIEIFKEGRAEDAVKRPLYTGFDNQTSIEFCVLEGEGEGKENIWYRLSNTEGKKKKELFAELTFSYSRKDGLYVSSSIGDLEKVDKIYDYFSDLEKQGKYWEILGVKEASDNIDTAWNFKIQVIFADEPEVIHIIHNAYQKLKSLGFVNVDISPIDVYLDGDLKGKLPCRISAPSGEHTITIKQGANEVGSETVNVSAGKRVKSNIPLSFEKKDEELRMMMADKKEAERQLDRHGQKITLLNNELDELKKGTSKVTLSLLVLLAIMSAIDIVWSPSPLFIFYLISFIGVFYKTKWGSGLSIFSGFIAFLTFDPLLLLLGILLMALGWKEYSVLKKS